MDRDIILPSGSSPFLHAVPRRPALTWRGAYDNVTAYQPNDVVEYQGSSYICILASTDNLPTNATNWSLLAAGEQDGADGEGGAFGGAQQAMANSVQRVKAIADAWERAAVAAERAAAAGGGSATNQAFGGMMHFAGGGFAPRGVDTIPTMLSPGEFVMNAKSSRKFYSQLKAMNAGQRSAYRDQGGSVTTIGDTTINVSGAGEPALTGEEIVRRINRTQRQGTRRIQ
jgi:hypothetical protein